MLSLVAANSCAFTPLAVPQGAPRAAVQMSGVENMIGKYSVKGTVYDPLGLADKYDVNWLREAEIKHGKASTHRLSRACRRAPAPRMVAPAAASAYERVRAHPNASGTRCRGLSRCLHGAGRVCMLAFLGWIANDAGLKFPGEVFQVRR